MVASLVADDEPDAAGILAQDVVGLGGAVLAVRNVFDGLGVVRPGGPLAQVHGAGAPLQDRAAVEVEVGGPGGAPARVVGVVGPHRTGPQPAVPVQDLPVRFRLGGQPAMGGDGRLAGDGLGVHGLQPAQLAAAGQFHCEHEVLAVATLAACLVDAAVARESVAQRLVLRDGGATGLLAVDIHSRLGGVDREQGVPALPGRDQQRVNVVPGQQFLVLAVHPGVLVAVPLVDHALDHLAAVVSDVAHGHHLHLGIAEQGLHVAPAAPANAEARHHDLVAGRDRSHPLAQHAAGHYHGGRRRGT